MKPVVVQGIELLFEAVDLVGVYFRVGHACNFLDAGQYLGFGKLLGLCGDCGIVGCRFGHVAVGGSRGNFRDRFC